MQSACNLGSKGKQEGAFTNLSFQLGLDRSIHSYDSKLILSWFVCRVTASQPAPYICWWENGDYKTVCVCVCACVCVLKRHCKGGVLNYSLIFTRCKSGQLVIVSLCASVSLSLWQHVVLETYWSFEFSKCLYVCLSVDRLLSVW